MKALQDLKPDNSRATILFCFCSLLLSGWKVKLYNAWPLFPGWIMKPWSLGVINNIICPSFKLLNNWRTDKETMYWTVSRHASLTWSVQWVSCGGMTYLDKRCPWKPKALRFHQAPACCHFGFCSVRTEAHTLTTTAWIHMSLWNLWRPGSLDNFVLFL